MSEFSVLLVSNASKDIYQDNNVSLFTNTLPRALSLTGNWHVALQTLSFDNNLSNLPHIIEDNPQPQLLLYVEGQNKTERLVRIHLSRKYFTPSSFQAYLQRTIPTACSTNLIASLTNEKQLMLQLKRCRLLILDVFCSWLQISTVNHRRLVVEGASYVEFAANQQDLVILCEATQLEGADIPKVIKLQLKEMRPVLSGKGFHQDLAVIPYTTTTSEDTLYHYEVHRKEFYSLALQDLQSLTLQLCDENNKQLNLPFGQPTFVKLNFRNMYGSSTFQVRVTSTDTSQIYPQNNAASFCVQLPHELSLPGNDWEVALSTLNYPTRIDPNTYLTNSAFWCKLDFHSVLVQWQPLILTFETDNITNATTLVNAINLKVQNSLGPNVFKASLNPRGNLSLDVGRVMTIHFSPLFAAVVGAGTELKLVNNVYERRFDKPAKSFLPELVQIERCLPHNMVLYCDIISPVIMGGKYCNVLKVVQVPTKDVQTINSTYVSNHLDFVDVAYDRVQSMNFQLQTIEGATVKFLDTHEASHVNLVFRKKEK